MCYEAVDALSINYLDKVSAFIALLNNFLIVEL